MLIDVEIAENCFEIRFLTLSLLARETRQIGSVKRSRFFER